MEISRLRLEKTLTKVLEGSWVGPNRNTYEIVAARGWKSHQPLGLLRGFCSKVSLFVKMVASQCAITNTPHPPSMVPPCTFASDLELRLSPLSLPHLPSNRTANIQRLKLEAANLNPSSFRFIQQDPKEASSSACPQETSRWRTVGAIPSMPITNPSCSLHSDDHRHTDFRDSLPHSPSTACLNHVSFHVQSYV